MSVRAYSLNSEGVSPVCTLVQQL